MEQLRNPETKDTEQSKEFAELKQREGTKGVYPSINTRNVIVLSGFHETVARCLKLKGDEFSDK